MNFKKAEDSEEIDNSCLWKENQPRLLMIDSKGSYSYVRKNRKKTIQGNEIKEFAQIPKQSDINQIWGGNLKIYNQQETTINDNKIINNNNNDDDEIDDEISLWSHYIDFEMKDKNFHSLKNIKFEIEDFDLYHNGLDCFRSEDEDSGISDSIHHWLEDCDKIKAIQLFSDLDTGFSGITENVLEFLREENNKKTQTKKITK